MGKTVDIEDGGIMLTDDWKLWPLDDRNWELCHRYVSAAVGRHDGGTEPTWHRCGKFYSYNTVPEAMLYVADQKMKRRARKKAMALKEAVAEFKDICAQMREAR